MNGRSRLRHRGDLPEGRLLQAEGYNGALRGFFHAILSRGTQISPGPILTFAPTVVFCVGGLRHRSSSISSLRHPGLTAFAAYIAGLPPRQYCACIQYCTVISTIMSWLRMHACYEKCFFITKMHSAPHWRDRPVEDKMR